MLALLSLATLSGAADAESVRLSGGEIELSADVGTGRITAVAVAGNPLVVSAASEASGFAIADRAIGPDFVPVPCGVRANGPGWLFEGEAGGIALRATVERTPASLGPIRVNLRDTSGEERAVSVRFALPINANGWAFSRSLDRRAAIAPGVRYDNAGGCRVGSEKLDLWPVTAISSPDATLALGVPMDEPRIFHVSHDETLGLFAITFDVALTGLTKKHPRQADFVFSVHGLGNGWGLRAALDAYYRTYPHLFARRTELAGGWFAWGDVLHIDPPVSDFGLRFHEGPASQDAKEHNAALEIATFPYIEPAMFQLHFGDFDHRPSREEIMERLNSYAAEADAESRTNTSTDPYGNVKRMCRAILKSGVRDANGELVIGAVGQYPWVAGNRWAAQFPLVLDPEIPDGAADLYLQWAELNLAREGWGDGQYLDSYSNHLATIDHDPDHLATSDFPACFDPNTLKPCQMLAIFAFEYVNGLREKLGPRDGLILVNAYGHNAPFPFHQFDVLGKEHWMTPSGRLFERYRAVAYRKPVTDLPSNEPATAAFLDECLVYDIFPGGYGRGNWGQEEMREDYRRVIPLLRLLDHLGWQPVPWATSSALEAKVERYGPPDGDTGPVCFAVYNPYAPQVIDLKIATAQAGIPKGSWCRELVSDRALSWKSEKSALNVSVGLGPRETALIAVGNKTGHRAILKWLASDRLADAGLCTIEWKLRKDQEHALAERLAVDEGLGRRELLVMAGELRDPDDPIDVRLTQLLREAGELRRQADSVSPAQPGIVTAPQGQPAGARLPWKETFETLDPERWNVDGERPGLEVRDGKLLLSLEGNSRGVGMRSRQPFDFGTRPLEFRFRFQYNHAGHEWYLMQSFRLTPAASGGSDDFLHIRLDPRVQVRVENGESPATNWQRTLSDWVRFEPNEPHEAILRIDKRAFRLTIDGKECASGAHELRFGLGYIDLGLYSGHGGHGDVCSFDEIEVREAPEE